MQDGRIGFGIIGCGVIGPWHAGAIARESRATLLAVCDENEGKARALAEQYPGAEVCLDYRKLLERKDIDVVDICTPSGLHADMAIDCARAGKHIISEKPLDIRLEQIDAAIAAAKQCKVKLAAIFQRRFQPNSLRLKSAIVEGRLGRLHTADTYIKWWREQSYYDSGDWRGTWALDGGGCLMNQGVHGIDLLQWLVGPVKSVYAQCATVAHERIEVEDQALALVEFVNGARGVIEGSTSCYPGLPTIHEIHGANGGVGLREEKLSLWRFLGDKKEEEAVILEAANAKKAETGTGDALASLGGVGDSHYPQIHDMVDAIFEDRDPACTGVDARNAVEIILAIYKSSREGRKVELPL